MSLTSQQPYMLRAFYEWMLDNELTPHLVVDATWPGVQVPQEHVQDGQIVLNIGPSACGKLHMDNIDVRFEARFGGVARLLVLPCDSVLAIYARENGEGTVFEPVERAAEHVESMPDTPPAKPEKGRPSLTVVK